MNYYYFYELVFLLLGNLIFLVFRKESGNSALCMLCSVISDSLRPQTVARQAPLSVGFSRQEYWNGLPFPSPGDFTKPESNAHLLSPALTSRYFTTNAA